MLQGFKAKLDEPKVTNVQTSTEKTKLEPQEEKQQINKLLREGLYKLPQPKQSTPIGGLHDLLHTPSDELFKAKQNRQIHVIYELTYKMPRAIKTKLTNKLWSQAGTSTGELESGLTPGTATETLNPPVRTEAGANKLEGARAPAKTDAKADKGTNDAATQDKGEITTKTQLDKRLQQTRPGKTARRKGTSHNNLKGAARQPKVKPHTALKPALKPALLRCPNILKQEEAYTKKPDPETTKEDTGTRTEPLETRKMGAPWRRPTSSSLS